MVLVSYNLNAQSNYVVNAGDYYFNPANLTINVGDTVTWYNDGGFHDVNGDIDSQTGASFGNPSIFYISPTLGPAPLGFHVFTVAGNYSYDCSIANHAASGMVGSITVNSKPKIDNDWIKSPDCANEPINPPISPTGNISVRIDNPSNVACILQLHFQALASGNFISGPSLQIGGAFVDSAGFNNISPNEYKIYLVDAADPTIIYDSIVPLSVLAPDSLVIQLVSQIDPTNILTSEGSIDISVSGGTPGYTYLWQEITNNFTASTEDINNLPVGNYQLTVTDFNNCAISESWTLEAAPCSPGDVEIINVSCYAEQDGQIIITGAYGIGPLTFAIDTVAPGPNFPTQLYQNSLHTNPTGSGSWTFSNTSGPSNYSIPRRVGGEVYYYYFTSADSACADLRNNMGEIEVDRFGDPYQIDTLVTPSDFGASNGSIQVTVNSGGYPYDTTTSPHTYVGYSYSWFDASLNPISSNSSTLSSLDSGTYYLQVSDNGLGCTTDIIEISVAYAPPCNPEIDTIIHNLCPLAYNGEIHVGSLTGYNKFIFLNDSLDTLRIGSIYDTVFTIVQENLNSRDYYITLLDTNAVSSTAAQIQLLAQFQLQNQSLIVQLYYLQIQMDPIIYVQETQHNY